MSLVSDHVSDIVYHSKRTNPPKLSIIIITLNEAKRIANLLTDLAEQSWQDFEVILVDSNSTDDTCAIAATFADRLPMFTIVKMNQCGVCLGRNTGAAVAVAERLLFLDADVRLGSDFLADAVSHLDSKRLRVAGVYLSAKQLPRHFKIGYGLFNVGIYLTQFVFPTAVGACLFSDKDIHAQITGFDETITLCEDCDYVKRASRLTRFRMLPMSFGFDPRRLSENGAKIPTRQQSPLAYWRNQRAKNHL